MPLRGVIADDHPLFRAGIVRTLQNDPRFRVVGEAGDGAAAEALIRAHEPELALSTCGCPAWAGSSQSARMVLLAVIVRPLVAVPATLLVYAALVVAIAAWARTRH